MNGGFVTGIMWGAVVSVVVLAAVSLSTPLPERDAAPTPDAMTPASEAEAPPVPQAPEADPSKPADAAPADAAPADAAPDPEAAPTAEPPVEAVAAPTAGGTADTTPARTAPAESVPLPSGSEFNRPPPDQAAVLPRADTAPLAVNPTAPRGATTPRPAFETVPAPQPSIATTPTQPAPTGSLPVAPPPGLGSAADLQTGGVSPRRVILPQVASTPSQTDRTPPPPPPSEPTSAQEPATEPQPVAEPAPEPETSVLALPTDDPSAPAMETPSFPIVPQAVVPTEPAAIPRLPQVVRGTGAPETPQVPQGAAAPDLPTTGARLPQVSLGGTDDADDEAEPVAAPPQTAAPETPANALRDNAVMFDADAARPLMAVVLIDEPEGGLDTSILTRFTFPVTFAIDPLRADATARAAELRAAGFEVVILGTAIPAGATPADTEVALAASRAALPNAVALLDSPDSRIQGDRPVLEATVAALAETGHGMVAFPRGLNAAEQTAHRNDVPAITVFRQLDDEAQRATVITRYLGRAAFAASQEGGVVVVGRTRPDTITALFSWALASRSEAVILAPLSAVLLRTGEGR